MMHRENWSGMFVTLGGIDKAGHMWGAQDDTVPQDCTTLAGMTHVRCAARTPTAAGQDPRRRPPGGRPKGGHTLVVLTADHGATYGQHFYGKNGGGPVTATGTTRGTASGRRQTAGWQPPYHPRRTSPLNADGNVQFSYQSTAIEAWLLDHSSAEGPGGRRCLSLPGRDRDVLKPTATASGCRAPTR